MSASAIDWPGIRATAVDVGVREAARQTAAHLPDDGRERFVFRVLKRPQREGWVVPVKAMRANDDRASAAPADYPLDRALEAALRPPCGDGDGSSGGQPEVWLTEEGGDAFSQASRARCPDEPETIAEMIAALPLRWMRYYAAALFRVGGIAALARRAIRPECGGISHHSVEKAAKDCPLFAQLIEQAERDGDGLVAAAVFKSATVGELQPVYQGGKLVGHRRTRNVKDAELWMRKRGMLAADRQEVRHTGKVELVQTSELPAVLAEVTARLFAARHARIIDVPSE